MVLELGRVVILPGFWGSFLFPAWSLALSSVEEAGAGEVS